MNDLLEAAEARANTSRSYSSIAPATTSRRAATVVKSRDFKASLTWDLKTSIPEVTSSTKAVTCGRLGMAVVVVMVQRSTKEEQTAVVVVVGEDR